jgi:hypothetical protein
MAPPRRGRSTVRFKPAASKKVAGKPPGVDEDTLLSLVPGGLASNFVNARLHDKALSVAGLQPPADWDGDMPELPRDIAKEDHDTLSNLMAQFASALSTAIWHAAKAYIEHGFYSQIVDYLEAVAILESTQSSEQKRKADATTNETVVVARALAQTAYSDYVRFREEGKTLKIRHATVSRVGGFVAEDTETDDQDEAPKYSALGSGRGSSRGSDRQPRRQRGRR